MTTLIIDDEKQSRPI